jgi:hypothetical protein
VLLVNGDGCMSNTSDRKPLFLRTVFVVLSCLILCAGLAQAYELTIDAPLKIQRGMPLVVNGTSNIPPGISIDVVFTKSGYVTEEVARETVTLQANQEFSVIFDTTDLTKGIYKVEVPAISGYRYLGNSSTLRIVEIIDRSDELSIRSLKTQTMNGKLAIEGAILAARNAGVQIEVVGPGDEVVYGPEYVSTGSDGGFAVEVPIEKAGIYNVSFTDSKGYVGVVPFTVIAIPETTAVPTVVPTTQPVISATAPASRDSPAYFAVQTGTGNLRVFTSSGVDWVIEYTDASGTVQKINNKGETEGEETVFPGTGGVMLFTVYPSQYSATGTVTFYAEGATQITAEQKPTGTTAGTTSGGQSAPVPGIVIIISVIGGGILLVIRRRH